MILRMEERAEVDAVHACDERDSPRVRVESVGQAAAGGLLLAVAIVELLLGFWAAGWHHRAIGLVVACLGAVPLTSGIAEIAVSLRPKVPKAAAERVDSQLELEA
jgi:hypothetical protein